MKRFTVLWCVLTGVAIGAAAVHGVSGTGWPSFNRRRSSGMSVTVPNCTLDADPLVCIEPRWVCRPLKRKVAHSFVNRTGGEASTAPRALKSTFKR